MRYGSVCSGVEAVSLAWEPLGFEPQWFAEIEPYCCELLKTRWPHVPNMGNLETLADDQQRLADIDVLAGGTPCQSFSVAGLRRGLDDDRGNLAFEFCRLVGVMRPSWLVWENSPGVLSSNGGRDFGSIVGALDELGYGLAWRVLDARHFGVPQRRRRVFVVGYNGDWRPPAAVLFERESLRGHSQAGAREKQKTARRAPGSRQTGDGTIAPEVASTLTARNKGAESSQPGRGQEDDYNFAAVRTSSAAIPSHAVSYLDPLCFDRTQITSETNRSSHFDVAPTLAESMKIPLITERMAIRRLTPREGERLQGMPDDHTAIQWRGKAASDTTRFRAIGNSMAVPVVRWLGERILAADQIRKRR